jgi:hypothetical protein
LKRLQKSRSTRPRPSHQQHHFAPATSSTESASRPALPLYHSLASTTPRPCRHLPRDGGLVTCSSLPAPWHTQFLAVISKEWSSSLWALISSTVRGGGDVGGRAGAMERVVVGLLLVPIRQQPQDTDVVLSYVPLLVMGFPGAAECCNHIAAYLKAGLQLSP